MKAPEGGGGSQLQVKQNNPKFDKHVVLSINL